MDPFSPNCKIFCYQGPKTGNLSILALVDLLDQPQTLSHQKSDVIYACFESWLKEGGLLSCLVER